MPSGSRQFEFGVCSCPLTQINDKDIHIIERLGSGASSIVFKAVLTKERKFVAVKKINVFERVGMSDALADAHPTLEARFSPSPMALYPLHNSVRVGRSRVQTPK